MLVSKDLNMIAEKSTDVLQRSLTKINALVDNVLISNAWGRSQLNIIGRRSKSILAPLYLIAEMSGLSRSSSIEDVEAAFVQYNNMLQDQAGSVLIYLHESYETLNKLKILVESIATAFLQAGNHQRLDKPSYWKWILRSHRSTMRDFDRQTIRCANFYGDLLQAIRIVNITVNQVTGVQANFQAPEDELDLANRTMTSGWDTWSIEMTVARLDASISYLDNVKQVSRAQERSRSEIFERDLRRVRDNFAF